MNRFLKITAVLTAVMLTPWRLCAQVNAEQVMRVGQNALYFEDYMLSIQYFNQAITAKPYLAQPWFFRAIAKLNLEDYLGAEEDATRAIERNPFIADAYEVRGVARQNQGKLRSAVSDYDLALEQRPMTRGLMFNKALALQELQDYDSAAVTFDRILEQYPGFDNGYVARARLRLVTGDTIAAMNDVNHALSINRNLPNAYLLRTDVTMKGYDIKKHGVEGSDTLSDNRWERAERDISQAIRLLPREAGLYVNRAYLRYQLDDLFGASADFDYAIQLDPTNSAAIFNRGLLRMEAADNDHAIQDFTRVLELNPDDYRSLYNRCILYIQGNNFNKALDDINRVIALYPDMAEAVYMRYSILYQMGRKAQAEKDYSRAMAMAREQKAKGKPTVLEPTRLSNGKADEMAGAGNADLTPEQVTKRFTALRTVESGVDIDQEYTNKNIRGRVQDRDQRIDIEPMFTLTYYTTPTDLKQSAYYMKEVDDVNLTHVLRMSVQVSNTPMPLTDQDEINRHFRSIEYYNSYLSTHTPRAIDYFGRAMDFMVLRDYAAAIEDLDRAITLSPDFALGYFARGVARSNLLNAGNVVKERAVPEQRAVIADFDKALQLSPRMALAQYNKGNALVALGDYTSALSAYNKAIELQPELGEAYYNRGYVYFQLGNREAGVENLSKAGELGVIPSYSLLKKMH
ncbi:MAG: tetratricopeptide repeat protein [Muribaculaceae bacterium]|nr:tetratricopeptide repeat protein [Muribaculaceae bacterium]